MSATRAFGLRSTFRAAYRPLRSPFSPSAGRRGYANTHQTPHGGPHPYRSSDLPWAIGALTVTITGLAFMSYNRPAKTQLSHEEHLEHASKTHGVGYGKPDEEVNRDEEGVARGSTPRPTSGGQTSDEETKGPLSDKKNVSIPEAVEDDLNKSPERIDYEMASPDGEGKEPPSDESKTDKGSSDGEGEQKKSDSDSKEKSSDESKTDKGSSDDEGKQKQSGSEGKETKPSDEKNADKNKGNGSSEGKQKQSGSDGKEKPSNSDGESNEMDDSHESQAKKLTDKDPSKRVDPTSK